MTPSKRQSRFELHTIQKQGRSSEYQKRLAAFYIRPELKSIKGRREGRRES
jgi:hypothetical protein